MMAWLVESLAANDSGVAFAFAVRLEIRARQKYWIYFGQPKDELVVSDSGAVMPDRVVGSEWPPVIWRSVKLLGVV